MNPIARYQEQIEEGLRTLKLPSRPAELYEPIRYILQLGGKRMRPVLTLVACDLFDGNPDDAFHAALGIELFHNFSLVHDDIMDKAPLRRNQQTVHEKWNPNIAILSGDALLVKAYQEMTKVPASSLAAILSLFNETALAVCEGQQLDMNYENSENVSIPHYLKMIELKTAALLAAALQTGAIIGGAKEEDAAHLYEFGKHIGIAFQLQDDILDVYGEAGKFGKLTGGDIIANKKTYLLLKAIEVSSTIPYKKEELLQWIYAPTFEPKDKVEAVTAIYDYLHIRKFAREEMEKHFQKALTHLHKIPVNPQKKQGLVNLAEGLMIREV